MKNKGNSMSRLMTGTMWILAGLMAVGGIGIVGYSIVHTKPEVTSVEVERFDTSPAIQSDVKLKTKTIKNVKIDFSRTVYMYSQVNPDSMSRAIIELNKLASDGSGEPVWLLLNSGGGSILHGEMLVTAIQNSKVPVYTVNTLICASMCAVIHQFGTKRYAFDRFNLMFHDAAGQFQGKFEEIKSLFNFLGRKIEKINRYIAKRADMSYEKYMDLQSHELWLDAEEAKDMKFVDEIINSQTDRILIEPQHNESSEENEEDEQANKPPYIYGDVWN